MKENITIAFNHFVNNVYLNLKPSKKKDELRHYVSRFKRNGINNGLDSLGINKAIEILSDYNYDIEIKTP